MKKTLKYAFFSIFLVFLILFFLFNQIDETLYFPQITPEEWLEIQPWVEVEFFSQKIILMQPSSTFFVYLLGSIAILIGVYLFKISKNQRFIRWWGLALILWGAGAIFAGTSYQVFSYEIKCRGRSFCLWTSWWEIIYLILSVGSVNAMLMAQAHLDENGKWSRRMKIYAPVSFLLYVIIVVIGSIISVQFLISFELMLLFLGFPILFLLILNVRRFFEQKKRIHLTLVIIWISLILIMGIYFLYLMLDITNLLWEQKIWFSENDILHIGLILWMIYIGLVMRKFERF